MKHNHFMARKGPKIGYRGGGHGPFKRKRKRHKHIFKGGKPTATIKVRTRARDRNGKVYHHVHSIVAKADGHKCVFCGLVRS